MQTWTKRTGVCLGVLLAACAPDDVTRPGEIGMQAAVAGGSTIRRNVIDGWNSADNMTLVQSGTLLDVRWRDGEFIEVEPGTFLSFDFANIGTNARVLSVKVRVVMSIDGAEPPEPCEPGEPCEPPEPPEPCEPLEPCESAAGRALLQVGGGSLSDPSVAMQRSVRVAATGTTRVTWDVTNWARTGARVNDLKLIIRNTDLSGERVLSVDRVFLVITLG